MVAFRPTKIRNKIVSRRFKSLEKKIFKGSRLSRSGKNLPIRFNVPTQGLLPISELGPRVSLPPMIRSYFGVRKAERSIRKNPESPFRFIDDDELAEFRSYASSLGLSTMGFTKMITPQEDSMTRTVIIVTMELDELMIDLAPSHLTYEELIRTYHNLGAAVNKLSTWLRRHNFYAQAIPPGSEGLDLTLLAESAGLGFHGKNGMFISPVFGSRVRLAAILTNIENLPLTKENPHTWIADYCLSCDKCDANCPGDAHLLEPQIWDGEIMVNLNQAKCAEEYVESDGCGVCLSRCPFSHASYEYILENFM